MDGLAGIFQSIIAVAGAGLQNRCVYPRKRIDTLRQERADRLDEPFDARGVGFRFTRQ